MVILGVVGSLHLHLVEHLLVGSVSVIRSHTRVCGTHSLATRLSAMVGGGYLTWSLVRGHVLVMGILAFVVTIAVLATVEALLSGVGRVLKLRLWSRAL